MANSWRQVARDSRQSTTGTKYLRHSAKKFERLLCLGFECLQHGERLQKTVARKKEQFICQAA
jgi:hypothetical protein